MSNGAGVGWCGVGWWCWCGVVLGVLCCGGVGSVVRSVMLWCRCYVVVYDTGTALLTLMLTVQFFICDKLTTQ